MVVLPTLRSFCLQRCSFCRHPLVTLVPLRLVVPSAVTVPVSIFRKEHEDTGLVDAVLNALAALDSGAAVVAAHFSEPRDPGSSAAPSAHSEDSSTNASVQTLDALSFPSSWAQTLEAAVSAGAASPAQMPASSRSAGVSEVLPVGGGCLRTVFPSRACSHLALRRLHLSGLRTNRKPWCMLQNRSRILRRRLCFLLGVLGGRASEMRLPITKWAFDPLPFLSCTDAVALWGTICHAG